MKVTRAWIAKNFNEFNKEYFNNALPTPNFQLCNTYRMLGQCGSHNCHALHPTFYIKISVYFDRTEKEYQNTLLHEMIHLYFQSKGEWYVRHGAKFQQMARSFDKYGWNIHTIEKGFAPKTQSGIIPTRHIMTFYDNEGYIWVCCVANDKTKQRAFLRLICGSNNYHDPKFYITNSDKFGSLKISHKRLGGKRMKKSDFVDEWESYLTEVNCNNLIAEFLK